MSPDVAPRRYRLAPSVVARLVGVGVLVLAVIVLVLTLVVTLTHGSVGLIVAVLLLGLAVLLALAGWLRGPAYVVRLDAEGYRVRLVRGAGVKQARWRDVEEAVAAHPRDIPCLVLHVRGGGRTTIPVGLLALDRDDFAREVRARLDAAAQARP